MRPHFFSHRLTFLPHHKGIAYEDETHPAVRHLATCANSHFLRPQQGSIQAVVGDSDVSLTVDAGTLPNGQIVELTGTLNFATDNTSYIHRVALVVDGPDGQDLDVVLPREEVIGLDLTGASDVTGESLEVTVDFDGVVESGGTLPGSTIPGETFGEGTLPGGTLPGEGCSGGTLPGTLPGGTIPGSTLPGGKGFIGIGDGGTITYSMDWDPALAGSYQGYLEVVVSGVNGCTLIRSDIVEFSVAAAPPNPEDPDTSKVTLCHVPRGNPAAAHVITVGARAVAAHLRHGDSISTTCRPSDDIDLIPSQTTIQMMAIISRTISTLPRRVTASLLTMAKARRQTGRTMTSITAQAPSPATKGIKTKSMMTTRARSLTASLLTTARTRSQAKGMMTSIKPSPTTRGTRIKSMMTTRARSRPRNLTASILTMAKTRSQAKATRPKARGSLSDQSNSLLASCHRASFSSSDKSGSDWSFSRLSPSIVTNRW